PFHCHPPSAHFVFLCLRRRETLGCQCHRQPAKLALPLALQERPTEASHLSESTHTPTSTHTHTHTHTHTPPHINTHPHTQRQTHQTPGSVTISLLSLSRHSGLQPLLNHHISISQLELSLPSTGAITPRCSLISSHRVPVSPGKKGSSTGLQHL